MIRAFVVIWMYVYGKDLELGVENKRLQMAARAEERGPLFSIFKPGMRYNTLTACLRMASAS